MTPRAPGRFRAPYVLQLRVISASSLRVHQSFGKRPMRRIATSLQKSRESRFLLSDERWLRSKTRHSFPSVPQMTRKWASGPDSRVERSGMAGPHERRRDDCVRGRMRRTHKSRTVYTGKYRARHTPIRAASSTVVPVELALKRGIFAKNLCDMLLRHPHILHGFAGRSRRCRLAPHDGLAAGHPRRPRGAREIRGERLSDLQVRHHQRVGVIQLERPDPLLCPSVYVFGR